MKPQISVIIPTYNRATFLEKSVSSVLNQTFKNFELIIIDDGSTDNSYEIIKNFNDSRIRYIRNQKNFGVSYSRNLGIKNAEADLIAFLDSDDMWKKEKLEIQFNEMKRNPDFLLSHTEEIWYKNNKRVNPRSIHKKRGGNIFQNSLKLCSISMSTVMVHKKLFDIVGLFDENLPACEDYDMWLRVTARYEVLLINLPLTIKFGGRPDQLSQKFVGLDKFRIYAIEKLLNSNILTKEQLKMAFDELKRKCEIYGKGCLKHNKKNEGEYYIELPEKYKYLVD